MKLTSYELTDPYTPTLYFGGTVIFLFVLLNTMVSNYINPEIINIKLFFRKKLQVNNERKKSGVVMET